MVYKLKILSDKREGFALKIEVDANNTFFELHEAIQNGCKFDPSEVVTFFKADEEWDKMDEISLFSSDLHEEIASMKNAKIIDYLNDIGDKMIYNFDMNDQKSLFIELEEILTNKKLNLPIVTYHKGIAPTQSVTDHYDNDLLNDSDVDLQNISTDFGEIEDLNLIYGEIGEVI